jgi:16S rRNA A1518/A1519 N6-dimethyltransferase RsmA/KsgA/DIM1 with predicted DNA glycosylase/AP lyase activity
MVNYYTTPDYLYVFGPEVFYPAPKVNSQLLILKHKKKLPFSKEDAKIFFAVIYEIFRFNNKKLRKALYLAKKNKKIKIIDNLLQLNTKFLDYKVHEINTTTYVALFKKVFKSH